MKIMLAIVFLAANLYFFLNIAENRYGEGLSPKQKVVGMTLTFLVITLVFLPHFWGYGGDLRGSGNIFFVLLTVIFCGLWLLLRFKPGIYARMRGYLIWLCCFLLLVLLVWPFLLGR